jgi:hypothetical protein
MERREWLSQWRATAAGETYRRRERGFGHWLKIQPHGSFRMAEVEPGEYRLTVRVPGFARLTLGVQVPGAATGQNSAAVDLGTLILKQ